MAYQHIENSVLMRNDPRYDRRYLHMVTINLDSVPDNSEKLWMLMDRRDHLRREIKQHLEEQLYGDFDIHKTGRSFYNDRGHMVICCRQIDWILIAKLTEFAWVADAVITVHSLKERT